MADQTDPFGDLTKMLEQFKVPGVDMPALVESRKKDIGAELTAARIAGANLEKSCGRQKGRSTADLRFGGASGFN